MLDDEIGKINERFQTDFAQVLLYFTTCEIQILELLKVANCLFNEDEFFKLINDYVEFKEAVKDLEKICTQVSDETKGELLLLGFVIKTQIEEAREKFEKLGKFIEKADRLIEQDDVDFEAADLLNDLHDRLDFDVADYEGFESALSSNYFIVSTYQKIRDDEPFIYGNLTVLMVKPFKNKQTAYSYALRNGISRDMIWSMY